MSTTAPRTTKQVLDEFKGLLELAVNLLDYPVLAKNEGAGLASDIRNTLREVGDVQRFASNGEEIEAYENSILVYQNQLAEKTREAALFREANADKARQVAELEATVSRLESIASDCATKLNEIRPIVMIYDMRQPAEGLVNAIYEILNRR